MAQTSRSFGTDHKRELIMRAKALRKLDLRVGDFGELSFAAVARIWEEVISQWLFVLSL